MIEKIKLPASLDNYQRFMDFIQAQINSNCTDTGIISDITIASEEVIVNVINYAYPGKKGDLEVSFEKKDDFAKIVFMDSGIFFNPLEKQAPDISKAIEDREIGGLGILLVIKLMNGFNYEYKENKNVLTIIKRLS